MPCFAVPARCSCPLPLCVNGEVCMLENRLVVGVVGVVLSSLWQHDMAASDVLLLTHSLALSFIGAGGAQDCERLQVLLTLLLILLPLTAAHSGDDAQQLLLCRV